MGYRFRKSIKVAPGVKLNIGKKSVGVSVGGKYGGVCVNSKTGARARVSAPGTGMSYTSKIGGFSKGSSKNITSAKVKKKAAPPDNSDATMQAKYEEIVKKQNLTKKKSKSMQKLYTVSSLSLILAGLLTVTYGIVGIIFIILGILFACVAHVYGNIAKTCFNSPSVSQRKIANRDSAKP